MLDIIKRKLSVKVSLILALITIPPMLVAAWFITGNQSDKVESLTISSGQVAAMSGARMYGDALEAGVDSGLLTMGDLFEPSYQEIKGYDFGDNPRFHTRYDFYTDRAVLGFQDAILASNPNFLYAVGNDVNGYLPTHDSKFITALTSDSAKDVAANRTKRKFTTPMHQAAARSLEPMLVQEYIRDTGEPAWDISSPIFVKGRHWGVFRVAVSRDALAAARRALTLQLAVVFGLLVVVTVGFIFLMLRRSMRPLEQLSNLAGEISTGEKLDQVIKAGSVDEIGQMAKSLNRLRASLQSAMGRLGE